MNIDRVYLCNICIKTYENEYWDKNGRLRIASECMYVKRSFVYHKENKYGNGEYIDLISNEKYKHFNKNDSRVGELFISGSNMMPLSNIIKKLYNEEIHDLSKRKVLIRGKEILNMLDEQEKFNKENICK